MPFSRARTSPTGYASLLVHTDLSRRNRSVVSAALDMAVRFDARVTGLHVNEPCYRPPRNDSLFPVWDGVNIGPQREADALDRDAKLQKDFEERASRAGCVASDWRYVVGVWARTIARHAVSSDLLIMGQHGRENHFGGYDAPAEIALRSTRPILIWPHTGRVSRIGERIVLAWNGSREAIAAMTGALPLLVQAAEVDVVIINEPAFQLNEDGAFLDENVALYLARHDVHVQISRLSAGRGDIANVLRSHIVDSRADLLCMGAYGHSRLREIALGGTTFELLRNMPVPTLIAS